MLAKKPAVKFRFGVPVRLLECTITGDYIEAALFSSLTEDDFFALIAVSIPCIIAVGVGGQPLTTTSTGMTLETLPQLA